MKRIIIIAALSMFLVTGGVAASAKLITGKDIKNGSITTKDLSRNAKQILKGNRGQEGPPGPQGPQGVPGPNVLGQMTLAAGGPVYFGDEVVQSATALCPAGQKVITGGGGVVGDAMNISGPLEDRSGWIVAGTDLTYEGGEYVSAVAHCAPAGTAVAARVHAVKPSTLRALKRQFKGVEKG